MNFDPARWVNPALLPLIPYQPGKPISECQREYGLSQIIKLASNENPLGTSAHVTNNLPKAFAEIARYPDANAYALKQALSAHLGCASDQLIVGNGSEDVLRMMVHAFVFADYHLLISQYAFIAYKIVAQSFGVFAREIPAHHFATDLSAMLAAITDKTRMIIFANPNNPTGSSFSHTAFKHFMEQVPSNIFVLCDEAYYEYMIEKDYPQTLTLLSTYPNLIITRTFSKAYGLAGLRIGYGIAHPEVIAFANRVRLPFNVNELGQVAACLALEDQAFVKESVAVNGQGKQQLYQGLSELGITYFPSGGNFIMIHLPKAHEIFQSLLKLGVIIRPLVPYQLADYFRISIGTEQENTLCLSALKKVLFEEKVT